MDNIKDDGFISVDWNVSVGDTKATSARAIAQRVIKQARPGAIILLHDGFETLHGADRSRTVQALPTIIQGLQEQGYTFVTLPQLLGVSPYLP